MPQEVLAKPIPKVNGKANRTRVNGNAYLQEVMGKADSARVNGKADSKGNTCNSKLPREGSAFRSGFAAPRDTVLKAATESPATKLERLCSGFAAPM